MFVEDIVFRTAEATQLPPQVLAEEVICLDSTSSGSEDDAKGKNNIKDGKWLAVLPRASHNMLLVQAQTSCAQLVKCSSRELLWIFGQFLPLSPKLAFLAWPIRHFSKLVFVCFINKLRFA